MNRSRHLPFLKPHNVFRTAEFNKLTPDVFHIKLIRVDGRLPLILKSHFCLIKQNVSIVNIVFNVSTLRSTLASKN